MSARFIEAISTQRGSVGSFKLSILCFVLSSQLITSIKKGPINAYVQSAVQPRVMGGYKIARLPHCITVRMVVPEQDPSAFNPKIKEDIHHRIGEYIEFVLKIKLLGGRHVGIRIVIAPIPALQPYLYKDRFVEQGSIKVELAIDK